MRILGTVLAAAWLGCAFDAVGPTPAPAQTPQDDMQPGGLSALEREVTDRINAHRRTSKKRTLERSDFVAAVARAHSRAMADGGTDLGHAGMQRRASELAARLPFAGMAENVARQGRKAGVAAAVVNSWLDSHVHRTNIEGDYHLTGVGAARGANGDVYLTQIFVRTERRAASRNGGTKLHKLGFAFLIPGSSGSWLRRDRHRTRAAAPWAIRACSSEVG